MIRTVDDDIPKGKLNAWVYLISIVPATITALLAPENVLSQSQWLNQYTLILREVLPAIDRLATVSSFPEVTSLVMSIEWSLLPVQAVLLVKNGSYAIRLEDCREHKFFLTAIVLLMGSVFLWSMIFLYELVPADLQGGMLSESLLRGVSTSRLGLGVVSSLCMAGTALMLGAIWVWANHIPHIYFGYERGSQQ